MQTLIIGAHLTGGVGKESGKPFAFAPKAYITAPIEAVESEKFWRKGFGNEPMEVELSEEAYNTLLRLAGRKTGVCGVFDVETTFRKERIAGRETPVMVISKINDPAAKAAA